MRRLPALPLAASLLLLCPALHASVRPHHHGSHAIARHTAASSHSGRAVRMVEHTSYSTIGVDRATQIQRALIERGYLTGEPTGSWDAASVAAMQKMQGDNGWQTKLVPDSRALIKLGLGPGTELAPPAATAATAAQPAEPISAIAGQSVTDR